MGLILLVVLVFVVLAVLPTYGYSRSWGYRPSGILGVVLLACLVLVCLGMIPWGFTYNRPVYVAQPVQVVNPPPVRVIDNRPITVINPAPNSGEGTRIVPSNSVPVQP